MKKIESLLKQSNNIHKEVFDNYENDAEYRWKNKTVEYEKVLFAPNVSNLDKVKVPSSGTLELSKVRTHSGNDCLLITANTNVEDVTPRPACGVAISLTQEDLTKYNRVALWVYPEAVGFQSFYFHFWLANAGTKDIHAPALTANEWNYVVWEMSEFPRDCVNTMTITPFLMGCPPEAEPELKVYIDEIKVQQVRRDHELGWELDERVAFCHSGYFKNAQKVALTQNMKNLNFKVCSLDSKVIYENKAEMVSSELGKFFKMDFSSLKKNGEYYITFDDMKTNSFIIDNNPYVSSIYKSINFLRLLRCGEDIPGVHSACHLNCRSIHPDGRSVPNFGGWHDAGDVSQFEICTAEMAHAVLDLAITMKDKDNNMYERLLEEAKVGIEWLLRTRFGDGMRALAVSYSIWRDNVLSPDNKGVNASVAENGPFENFCSAAALAVAYREYLGEDPIFAEWCLRAAKEDFMFAIDGYEKKIYTKRWGPNIDSQVCGHGALAASELFFSTNDNQYIEIAAKYAKVVLACQQSKMPNWEKPIRGFFYENPKHTKILCYEHRGHEQSPVQGLCRIYEIAPNHPDANKWLKGIKLYKEFILKTANVCEPYGMMPAQVYDVNKLDETRFTIPASYGTIEEGMENMKEQIRTGLYLNEGIYLRKFPIAVQRRGYHATLLSKTKGLTMVMRVLNDKQLRQIAINQLEWILGKNPFASSSMYGEGYNYHPLYVAFSRQMVGALPVGFKTEGTLDAPYWPVANNAVFKEIWGHTTGKFLWILADLL